MRRLLARLSAVLAAALLLVAPAQARHGDGWAQVVRIVDGDTFDVRTPYGLERVRLFGVDAPEAGAPGGREARSLLGWLVFTCNYYPGWVWLEAGPRTVDRYGRSLYYAWVNGDCGPDLNPWLWPGWQLIDQLMVYYGGGRCWWGEGQYWRAICF